MKDTVAKEGENDEVEAVDHASIVDASHRHDAIVHHFIPVFTGQYL
jgi:hypothetical protein